MKIFVTTLLLAASVLNIGTIDFESIENSETELSKLEQSDGINLETENEEKVFVLENEIVEEMLGKDINETVSEEEHTVVESIEPDVLAESDNLVEERPVVLNAVNDVEVEEPIEVEEPKEEVVEVEEPEEEVIEVEEPVEEEVVVEVEEPVVDTVSNKVEVYGGVRFSNNFDNESEMVRKINAQLSAYPMSGYGEVIVNACRDYDIDPYFVTSIAIWESTAGKFMANTNNPFGRMAVGGGWMAFDSLEEAIYNQASYLKRYYVDVGLDTIESISYKYCPPTAQDWAKKKMDTVNSIKNK